jgi:hypothetical protein
LDSTPFVLFFHKNLPRLLNFDDPCWRVSASALLFFSEISSVEWSFSDWRFSSSGLSPIQKQNRDLYRTEDFYKGLLQRRSHYVSKVEMNLTDPAIKAPAFSGLFISSLFLFRRHKSIRITRAQLRLGPL